MLRSLTLSHIPHPNTTVTEHSPVQPAEHILHTPVSPPRSPFASWMNSSRCHTARRAKDTNGSSQPRIERWYSCVKVSKIRCIDTQRSSKPLTRNLSTSAIKSPSNATTSPSNVITLPSSKSTSPNSASPSPSTSPHFVLSLKSPVSPALTQNNDLGFGFPR
jgi:hypothetical protein